MAKPPRKYATFGPFVFSHVYLTAPDEGGQYSDGRYKVDAVADPASDTWKQVQSTILEALKEFGLPDKGTQKPVKKEVSKDQGTGQKAETGKLVLRAKSKFAPAIVDAAGNPIPAAALAKLRISAGSEGLIQGYFTPYQSKEKVRNSEGGVDVTDVTGITFTLTGAQITKLVKAGGSGFSAFAGGGFTYEGAAADELEIDTSDEDFEDAHSDQGGLDI